MQVLHDRENENHRLSQQLTDMRDAAIHRDLVRTCRSMQQRWTTFHQHTINQSQELTSVKQAMGAHEAAAGRAEAQKLNSAHAMQQSLDELQQELDEEKSKRQAWPKAEETSLFVHTPTHTP